MNWFRRLFVGSERQPSTLNECYPVPSCPSADLFESAAHMTFSIMRAQGGIIVRVQKYDYERQSRSTHDQPIVHVIPDTEDFQASLNKIIVLETLRA
jgi:hypothetical protein